MATYVISDIHGHYHEFLEMLKVLNFSDADFMYVLGDVIDRGPEGLDIINDIRSRKNMQMFLGNHELMMINAIKYVEETGDCRVTIENMDDHLTPLQLWTHAANGGEGTFEEMMALSPKGREDMVGFLKSLPLIKRFKLGGVSYHLSHSYSLPRRFGNTVYQDHVSKKEMERIVWDSLLDREGNPYETPEEYPFYYKRDTYVVGHIFTQRLSHLDESGKAKIFKCNKYRGYRIIDLDCGMALNCRSSRLGCMCLETGEEFYISLMDDEANDSLFGV